MIWTARRSYSNLSISFALLNSLFNEIWRIIFKLLIKHLKLEKVLLWKSTVQSLIFKLWLLNYLNFTEFSFCLLFRFLNLLRSHEERCLGILRHVRKVKRKFSNLLLWNFWGEFVRRMFVGGCIFMIMACTTLPCIVS